MDKKMRDRIRKEVESSSVSDEIKVLYEMANATELMSVQINERIKSIYVKHGYKLGENELLTGLNNYCKAVKSASFLFEQRAHPQIADATADGRGGYDRFNTDSNELCRLILTYIDRCARSDANMAAVFGFLRSLPQGGIFDDEDIDRFRLNDG